MSNPLSKHYTTELPPPLYRTEQVRELDRFAIEEVGIAGFELMSRAAQAAFSLLLDRWPNAQRIAIYCGSGNNGGDGYVVAALAERAGLEAHVIQVGDPAKLGPDAAEALHQAELAGAVFEPFDPEAQVDADLVVDALLGTGLTKPVVERYLAAVEQINAGQAPVLALDIPSGLDGNTGTVLGVAVKAQATISFLGMKQGLLTGEAPDYCGELFFASLEVPAAVYQQQPVACQLVGIDQLRQWLPPRQRTAHKGQHGRVLIIGGDLGFGGAALMAADAAARSGAGLITVITRPEHITAILTRRPECMALGVNEGQDISAHVATADVLVVGPGIGQGGWGEALMRQALASSKPMVLDADGLNFLAQLPADDPLRQRGNWVLTPHPGEASRLLQCSIAELEANRFQTVAQLRESFAASAVLKGAGSLIADFGGGLWLSSAGNPGMATGGMGDVLSGVIGGLAAQGLALDQAAVLGVWIHGKAGDRASANAGQRGLVATDLMPHIRRLLNDYA